MNKIVAITHMAFEGSGYLYLTTQLLSGLAKLGYEIKVVGLEYKGQEHDYPFSIIPAQNLQDCHAIANNLVYLWGAELFIVAFDIPQQQFFFNNLSALKKKYIAITPLENGPLKMSWAAFLMNLDSVFFISELGKQEALKVGVHNAEHLEIGVDTVFWHPATKEEKFQLRNGLGIPEDAFVVLTVAANQERKNLWATMSAMSKLVKANTGREIRYILVTDQDSPVGWNILDMAVSLGIQKELILLKRGMPTKDLWGVYSLSDVFLLGSKAEGLGMPVLEAMACGIPVVATDTGALHELLDKRGFLIPPEYSYIDPWGNSRRDMVNIDKMSKRLFSISNGSEDPSSISESALSYVRSRIWDIPVKQLDKKIKEISDEQTKQA